MVESTMIISCPRQTTTRAAHRRKFEFIIASKEPNRCKDDHYNRIIMVFIAWIIWRAGILILGDRIDGRERQREALGRRVRLARDPALQASPPPVDGRAPRHAAQGLHAPGVHPRSSRHHPAGARKRALDGREHRCPHPERARGGPDLGAEEYPSGSAAAHCLAVTVSAARA